MSLTSDNNEEVWLPIKDFENQYHISSHGRVKSLHKKNYFGERILKAAKDKGGYSYVYLCKDGKGFFKMVHRLVAITFEVEGKGYAVNHIDHNRSNNHLTNLEFVSRRENINHGLRKGKYLKGVRRNVYGGPFFAIVNGKYRGSFLTEEEAHLAYIQIITELGESKYAIR